MKTVIKLPVPKNAKILVREGDKVSAKTEIIKIAEAAKNEEIIPVASLLKIKAKNIAKYLRKGIGEEVNEGQVLAQKKSFISQLSIKSPIAGRIAQIDVKQGTLKLEKKINSKPQNIQLPVSSTVKKISSSSLEMEVDGHQVSISQSSGDDIVGELYQINGHDVTFMDIDFSVEDKVVLIEKLQEDIAVKLDALGSRGVITCQPVEYSLLPIIKVNHDTFKTLCKYTGKKAWLCPSAGHIIILE